MIDIKIIFVVIVGVIVLMLLSRNTGKWARALQQYYIGQANKMYGNSAGWDQSWRLGLFKVLIIFFGLMVILGVYVVAFSV